MTAFQLDISRLGLYEIQTQGGSEKTSLNDESSTVDANLDEGLNEGASQANTSVLDHFHLVMNELGYEKDVDYDSETLMDDNTLANLYPEFALQGEGKSEFECCFEGLRYWYHPDYLGSVQMVTDSDGEVYQYFFNNPWGEQMYEYYPAGTGFDSPYRFNGKELDEETGFAYYGARYYDNQISMWLSVDPLAMKGNNATMSPYNFTDNNPVMLLDPDGNNPILPPWLINLAAAKAYHEVKAFFNDVEEGATRTVHAGVRVATNRSGELPEHAPIPDYVRRQNHELATIQDATTAVQGFNDFSLAVVEGAGNLPGVETVVDAVGLIHSSATGDLDGVAVYSAGLLVPGVSGSALRTVKSFVKSSPGVLRLSRQTFRGNQELSREANSLVFQLSRGNLNPGLGTRSIAGATGLFEARGSKGARVYFRHNSQNEIEILGYSHKDNQTQVINQIKNDFNL